MTESADLFPENNLLHILPQSRGLSQHLLHSRIVLDVLRSNKNVINEDLEWRNFHHKGGVEPPSVTKDRFIINLHVLVNNVSLTMIELGIGNHNKIKTNTPYLLHR